MESKILKSYELSSEPKEVSAKLFRPDLMDEIVRKFLFTEANINPDHIRIVKAGKDIRNGNPRILVEISKKAFKQDNFNANNNKHEEKKSYLSIVGNNGNNNGDGKKKIDPKFFDALRNKAFYGGNENLKWEKVKYDEQSYYKFEFDPEILMAYILDINFCDPYFKIYTPSIEWVSKKELEELSGKARRNLISTMKSWKADGLTNCLFNVFRTNGFYTKTESGECEYGFKPSQIEEFRGDEDKKKKKKKKKHRRDDD